MTKKEVQDWVANLFHGLLVADLQAGAVEDRIEEYSKSDQAKIDHEVSRVLSSILRGTPK